MYNNKQTDILVHAKNSEISVEIFKYFSKRQVINCRNDTILNRFHT